MRRLQNVKTVSPDILACLGSPTTAVTVTKGPFTHVQGFKYHRFSAVRHMCVHTNVVQFSS